MFIALNLKKSCFAGSTFKLNKATVIQYKMQKSGIVSLFFIDFDFKYKIVLKVYYNREA